MIILINYDYNYIGYENSNDVFPIYIGDDRTDEDAFKVKKMPPPFILIYIFLLLILIINIINYEYL